MVYWNDYDSSVVDSITKWVRWMNETENLSYTVNDVASYDWVVQVGEKHNFNAFAYFDDSMPYKDGVMGAKPIRHSREHLEKIEDLIGKGRVGILTATHDDALIPQKNKHIEKHFGDIMVVHDHNKHEYATVSTLRENLLKLDIPLPLPKEDEGQSCPLPREVIVILDDNPTACEEFVENGGVALLYDHFGTYKFAKTEMSHPKLYLVSTYDEAFDVVATHHKKEQLENKISDNQEYSLYFSEVYKKQFAITDSQFDYLEKHAKNYLNKIDALDEFTDSHYSKEANIDIIIEYAKRNGVDIQKILHDTNDTEIKERNNLTVEIDHKYEGFIFSPDGDIDKSFIVCVEKGNKDYDELSMEADELSVDYLIKNNIPCSTCFQDGHKISSVEYDQVKHKMSTANSEVIVSDKQLKMENVGLTNRQERLSDPIKKSLVNEQIKNFAKEAKKKFDRKNEIKPE